MYHSASVLLSGSLKFLLFCAMISPFSSQGQTGYCYDSLAINKGIVCPYVYDPLCGCDGNTYRNHCEMYYHHGINDYRSGICEPMAIEFYPNPGVRSIHMTLLLKEKDNAYLYIYDLYGKLWYYQSFLNMDKLILDIELTEFPMGLYFIIGQTTGYSLVKRLIRIPG